MKNTRKRTESNPETSKKSNAPETTVWADDVGASLWRRVVNVKGVPTTFYSITFERSYRDRDGSRKYARSFDPEHLTQVQQVCQKADHWLKQVKIDPPANPA